MSLEARLTALADDAFPPTPDLAARWAGSIAPQPMDTAQRWRRWPIAVAIAAVLIPAGTVAAVELWGPDNVRLESVDRLPAAPPPAQQRGEVVKTLGDAERLAGFTPHLPPFLAAPATDITVRGRIVRFRAGTATVTELPGSLFVEKTLGPDSDAERVTVDGEEGWFITGGPHDVVIESPTGVEVIPRTRAGNVLVYERDGIVVRIEGLTAPPRSPAP